jgi:hypothetical protein
MKKSNEGIKILDLISEIDIDLRLITTKIKKIVVQKMVQVIKKYDLKDSSLDFLPSLD